MNTSFYSLKSKIPAMGVGPAVASALLLAAALSSSEVMAEVSAQHSDSASQLTSQQTSQLIGTDMLRHNEQDNHPDSAALTRKAAWWSGLPNKISSVFRFHQQDDDAVTVDRRYLRFDMRAGSHNSLKWIHRGERPMPSSVGFNMRWRLGAGSGAGQPTTSFLIAME